MSLKPPNEGTPGATGIGSAALNARLTSVESRSLFLDDYCEGDGTTDDTTGLLAAITAADGKKLIARPDATYLYSSILYTATNGIVIDGQGCTFKSSLALATNTGEFWIKGSDVTIRDATFTQAVSVDVATEADERGANAHTVRIGGTAFGSLARRVCIENVSVLQSRNTPILGQYLADVRISGCTVRNALGNGIFIGDSEGGVRIEGNRVYNTGDDGIGVYQNIGNGVTLKGVVIDGNHVELSDAKGIGVGADDVVVANNIVKQTYTGGVMLIEDSVFDLYGCNHAKVHGNVIVDAGTNYGARLHATVSATNAHGIEVNSTTQADLTIEDNLIVNPEQKGIQVTGGQRIVVRGNTIKGAGATGINCANSDAGDYDDLTNLRVIGNTVIGAISGINVGSVDGGEVADNYVRSFDSGDAGETRGIFYGWVKNFTVARNVVINDDSATYTIRERPASTNPHTRVFANMEVDTSQADPNVRALSEIGANRVGFGSAAPTVGAWAQGDVIFSTGAGGSTLPSASGWQCRASGSPGTWKQFGAIGIAPYSASATWDPGSVADGAVTSTTVTVTGVGITDACEVMVGHSAGIPAGAILAGSVTGANTVTVTLFNHTGSALDVASGTLRVTAYKHQ